MTRDKHKIDFLEEKDFGHFTDEDQDIALGKHPVRSTCTPDCSFGLAVDDEDDSEEDTNAILTSKGSLNAKCLRDLFLHWKTGLTSDPKIMNFGLAFPWAVYEAKKGAASNVYMQIERASEIYLRVLHDLALLPGKSDIPRAFQSEQSSHFKIFSWTSEGPNWKMFVCYHRRQPEDTPLWLPASGGVPQYVRL